MSHLNQGVDLNLEEDLDERTNSFSSDDLGLSHYETTSDPGEVPDVGFVADAKIFRSNSNPCYSLSSGGSIHSQLSREDELFNNVFVNQNQRSFSDSGEWVDLGSLNSEDRTRETLHTSGWFEANSFTDSFKKFIYDTGFWLGLIFSSLKQYEPALGFFIEHANVESYNPGHLYWLCVILSFPCAFSQAGLVIQGKKDYANKYRKIELAKLNFIDNPDDTSSARGKDGYSFFIRALIRLISVTGVVSQSYWIGAQLWTLPYFQRDLGFKENMQKYFYNYELGSLRFSATLAITLFGAKGYWNQMIHYSSILIDNLRAYFYNSSEHDEKEHKKRKLFAKYVMDVRKAGKLFFNNAKISKGHILAKSIPKDVIWLEEKFAFYVQDFFELLFDGDFISPSKRYRFRAAEVESSVFSALFQKYIYRAYKSYNCSFAGSKPFRYGLVYPLAIIGLYQNLFGFKTPFSNIPGMEGFLIEHKGGEAAFQVLTWVLGFLSILNHISFNIEGIEALAVIKADLVRIEASLLSGIAPMQIVRAGSYYQINDGMLDQVKDFHEFRRKVNSVIQALANIWLVTVTVLAAIFTALVSTKDSPFPEDNKSLASAWFVFSIFVVISQIVSQVTTKGEKAMKFVKYLAREFGAMDKTKRPLKQRVLDSERSIYEQTYKFYNKLRELYGQSDGQDVLTQGHEDLTLGELVTKIKEFYTDDLSIDSSADSGADYRYIEQGLGSIQQGPAIEGAFAAAHTGGDSNESRVSLIMQDTLL